MSLDTNLQSLPYGKARTRLRSEYNDLKRRHPELIETEEWQEFDEALGVVMGMMSDMHLRLASVLPRDCRRCGKPLQGSREASYWVNGYEISAFQCDETLYRCSNTECVDHGTLEVYQNKTGNLVWRFPPPLREGVVFSPEETVRTAIAVAYTALVRTPFAGNALYEPGTKEHSIMEAAALATGVITADELGTGLTADPPSE